jgi:hypothetical protein
VGTLLCQCYSDFMPNIFDFRMSRKLKWGLFICVQFLPQNCATYEADWSREATVPNSPALLNLGACSSSCNIFKTLRCHLLCLLIRNTGVRLWCQSDQIERFIASQRLFRIVRLHSRCLRSPWFRSVVNAPSARDEINPSSKLRGLSPWTNYTDKVSVNLFYETALLFNTFGACGC